MLMVFTFDNATDIVKTISQNPWASFITLISVIVVAVISGIAVISSYRNRPKLEYKLDISDEAHSYLGKFESRLIHFTIHIKNKGKKMAEHCLATMKITDHTGKINVVETTKIKTINDDFQIPLFDYEGTAHEVPVEILPSNRYEFKVSIPFLVTLAVNREDVLGGIHMPLAMLEFKEPLRRWKWDEVLTTGKYYLDIGVEVSINSSEYTFVKHFKIRIPQPHNSIIDRSLIEFEQS